MAQVQRPHSKMPPKPSTSFDQMLQLEKQAKPLAQMYRFNEAPPSATSPSGTTTPSPQSFSASRPGSGHDASSGPGPATCANRSRRATTSHHPAPSEDHMIKANRMTAMHPLSLSVPSIPKQAPAQSSTDSFKADRRAVAFSEPEDNEREDQSDNSSICQSPSWEGWNKKKKKPKTPSVKEKKEKKRGNRLSKHPKTVSPTDRVISAPQLDASALPKASSDTQLAPANYPPPPPIPEDTDTMFSRSKRRQSHVAVEDKPKSRKFLSGFRFQSSANMTAVQKIIQEGGHAEAPQMRKSLSAGPETAAAPQEPLFMNPVNATPRSHSSIDSRPPLTSLPSSSSTATSGHGRSHSLLSSTFGRLRSPSQGHHSPGNIVDPAVRPVSHMVEYSKHVYPEHVVQTPGSIRDSVLVSSSELTEAGPLSPPNFHHPPLALQVPQGPNRASTWQHPTGGQRAQSSSQYEAYRVPEAGDAQQPPFMRRETNKRYTQKSITAAGLMQRQLKLPEQQDAYLTSSSQEEEYASAPENLAEQGFPGQTQGPPSTIRPFRPQENFGTGSKPKPSTNSIGCAITDDVLDEENAAKNAPGPAPRSSKRENPEDYFSFISESYAPPSLELRSPLDNMLHTLRVAELPDNSREDEPTKITSPGDRPASHDGPTLERLAGPSGKSNPAPEYGSSQGKAAETNPNNSGGSSSSAGSYDDSPPSPSTTTTVDNSRPQSRKGASASQTTEMRSEGPVQTGTTAASPPRTHGKSFSVQQADDDWSRSAMPLDFEESSTTKGDGTDTPSQVSTPGSAVFVDDAKEPEPRKSKKGTRQTMPPRSQSASDLPSTYFLPPLKHQSLNPKKGKARMSSPGLPALPTPPAEPSDESRPSSSGHKARSHSGSSQEGNALVSASAYLQEARRAVPSQNRMSRAPNGHRSSASTSKIPPVPEPQGEPVAKVLVQCCNCKFLHDMPSRVYEAMAKPDSMVEDKLLGVSAAISTTVKCPWCTHGMSTQCCAGYAAVVYLKEKLHGK